jgi:hypothetical protein
MVIEATAAILAVGVYITPLVICAHVKLAVFEGFFEGIIFSQYPRN